MSDGPPPPWPPTDPSGPTSAQGPSTPPPPVNSGWGPAPPPTVRLRSRRRTVRWPLLLMAGLVGLGLLLVATTDIEDEVWTTASRYLDGDDDWPAVGGTADPAACASGAPVRADIPVEGVENLSFLEIPISGTFAIEVHQVVEVPATFDDPFIPGELARAQGRFIGYRVTVTNNATTEFQLSQVADWLLTDGQRSWPTADYSSANQLSVSSSWSVTQGDEQLAAYVAPGFAVTSWLVFDVPADATPTALMLPLTDGQTCIASP